MAIQDTTNETEEVLENQDQVETGNTEDEQLENQDTEEVEGTEDTNEEQTTDSDATTETEEDDKAEFTKRFSQFKGETLEEYTQNLEEGHRQSITEAQRLALANKDLQTKFDKMMSAVAKNPDLAKFLEEATGENAPAVPVDPALAWAKQEMNKTFDKEYKEFADLHPEILSDEELRNEVFDEFEALLDVYDKKGKPLGMAEGLKKAWIILGKDVEDSKDTVVNKTKEQAATPAASTKPKKPADKPQFTEEQKAFAAKMGLTPEQLAEYSK